MVIVYVNDLSPRNTIILRIRLILKPILTLNYISLSAARYHSSHEIIKASTRNLYAHQAPCSYQYCFHFIQNIFSSFPPSSSRSHKSRGSTSRSPRGSVSPRGSKPSRSLTVAATGDSPKKRQGLTATEDSTARKSRRTN
jgi:hypothetical protein